MKKLVLYFFNDFYEVHLKKDVGLFPVYLKQYFDSVELKYIKNKNNTSIPEEYRGIKILPFCNFSLVTNNGIINKFLNYFKYLSALKDLKKNNDCTHVMIFHWSRLHLQFLSKAKEMGLKTYLKMDIDESWTRSIINECENSKYSKRNFLTDKIKKIDLITVESQRVYEIFKNNILFKDKIHLAQNGYDDALLKPLNRTREKVILSVGRLGTEQKNTEMILQVARLLNLKDWKIYLVGSVEDSFNNYIKTFFEENPNLRENIIFKGVINDSEELVRLYQMSSVFLLTSRWEGSALVLLEAAINGCFICSTEVGAIYEIDMGKDSCYICPDSRTGFQDFEKIKENFVLQLQKIIDGEIDITLNQEEKVNNYVQKFLMSNITGKEFFKEYSNI